MTDWTVAHANNTEALRITQTDRNKSNGDAEDNFDHIARSWSALLYARGILTADLNAADVARMMVALKLCRDAHQPHPDNRVDGHGYLLCLDRVEPAKVPSKITTHPLYYEKSCRTCRWTSSLAHCVGCDVGFTHWELAPVLLSEDGG